MTGCEKVCGRCEDCRRLAWSLQWVIETEDVERVKVAPDIHSEEEQPFLRAVLDPAALAEIIARALHGRGFKTDNAATADIMTSPTADGVALDHCFGARVCMTMPEARAA